MEEKNKRHILDMAAYFNRSINAFALNHWAGKMHYKKQIDVQNGTEACMNGEKFFPTLDKFLWYVDQEKFKREAREREADQKRNEMSKKPETGFCTVEMNREFWKIVNTLMNYRGSKIDKLKYELQLIEEINQKYGGMEEHMEFLKKEIYLHDNQQMNLIMEVFDVGIEAIKINHNEEVLMEG